MSAESSECQAPSCPLPSLSSSISFPRLSQESQPQQENQMSQLNHSLMAWALPRDISGHVWTFPREMEKVGFPMAVRALKPQTSHLCVHALTLAYCTEGESCCSLLHSRLPFSGQSKARRGRSVAPGFIPVVTQMRRWRSSKADPPSLRPRKCVCTEKCTQQPPSHALPLTCPFGQ